MTKFLHLILTVVFCLGTFGSRAQAAEVTTVLDADFTQFTSGSPTSPVDFPSYGSGSFTSTFPSWYVYKVAQAGGALLIKDGGYVQTKTINLSANGGVSRITVRMKAMDDYGAAIKISAGYSTAGSTTEYIYSNEWTDVTVILTGGSSASKVKIEPVLSASGILVQSLKVEQSPGFIAAPKASQPTQADNTSFTAKWASVSGATNYYLDVYSYNDKNEKVYLIQNEDCGTSLSKKVTGLDANTTYFYVVRASNGTAVSADSNEIEVVAIISSIDTPEVSDATVDNGKATITWNSVPNAKSYVVTVFRHSTLTADTEIDLINDDFAKVTQGTLKDIEFTYDYKLDQYTNITGWGGEDLGLSEGCIVLTPFSGATGSLITPAIDLSSNEGACSVSLNLAEAAYGYFRSGGTATVKLLDANGEVLEQKDITLKENFTDYQVDFTEGAADCKIGIYYAGSYKLFISSVVVKQTKPAGAVITEVVSEEDVDGTSYTFDYTPEENVEIGYQVMAVGRTVQSGEISEITSEASAEKFVKDNAAIDGITSDAAQAVVTSANGCINVTVPAEAQVSVYDLSGRMLRSVAVAEGTTIIEVSANGVVIVRVNNESFKVIL